MLNFEWPEFEFSAPIELAKRMEQPKTENQAYRSVFMRDRDRIMYSSAFRRLSGKTQVYLTGIDDNRRNRLTHTLEVSQIARTISRALGLDCDLTEAIALAHDLGHTPFGHAGEQILHEIMVPNSPSNIRSSPLNNPKLMGTPIIRENIFGFKHNVQSVRIAATTENNYGKYGLNLTNYTLWGILHHSSTKYKENRVHTNYLIPDYLEQYRSYFGLKDHPECEAWSFEAFVVREADEIAQWHHDLEDALRGGAMTSKDVCETVFENISHLMSPKDLAELKVLDDASNNRALNKEQSSDLARIVVNTLVNRLIECSILNLNELWKEIKDNEDKNSFFINHKWDEDIIQSAIKLEIFGEAGHTHSVVQSYPSVITEKIHHSREVERMNAKGQYIIKKLFQAYWSHPQQLPNNVILQYMVDIQKLDNFSSGEEKGLGFVRADFEKLRSSESEFTIQRQMVLMRRICDHIAGMTDHYAIEEFHKLYI